MDAKAILDRLQQTGPDSPAARLAALLVDELLDQPLGALAPPGRLAAWARELLLAWAGSEDAEARAHRQVEDLLEALQSRPEPLAALAGPTLAAALHSLADLPRPLDRELVLTLIDREPVRQLLRAMLVETLVGFGRKLRQPLAENTFARGLGDLGRSAFKRAAERAGALGALASDVVDSVSEQADKQVERLANEFADTAMNGLVRRIAERLCDPARASEQAAIRRALLEGALELTGPQLAQAARRQDLAAQAARGRAALRGWLASAEAQPQLERAIALALHRDLALPARRILEDLGILAPFAAAAREAAASALRPVLGGERFARWLGELLNGA